MRTDANRIAIRAIRAILDAAHPLELAVAGTTVQCVASHRSADRWPEKALPGIDEGTDGPWPRTAAVACTWEGGRCSLEVICRPNSRDGQLALSVYLGPRGSQLVWVNIPRRIHDAVDATLVHADAQAFLKKRKSGGTSDLQPRLSQILSSLTSASSIPMASQWNARLFDVEVPSGSVQPSPAVAFQHLVHLALLKLDFFSRAEDAKDRGRPLVDVAKLMGVPQDAPGLTGLGEDGEDEDDAEAPARKRRYWAGGFQWGNESKREEFIAGNYWQVGWPRTAEEAPAKTTWLRFDELTSGDLLAIKGYGGQHDLVIHYVGEVVSVDREAGRISLKRFDTPLYKGKAPRGGGAGNWFDTLVPITRKEDIAKIFGARAADGVSDGVAAGYDDIPLNLILYGPPGTGKTYRLQEQYLDRFTRSERQIRDGDAWSTAASELTYFEVIVVAIYAAPNRKATVDQILAHPVAKAKYQANAPKSMRQIVWGTLGQHTVEESTTVKMKRRLGDLVFDKDADGRWFFPGPLPPELREMAERVTKTKSVPREVKDYDFVTFHQAYAYEDFIEGIRPNLVDGDDEDTGGRVGYALRDGIFKEAVRKAVQLTGFDGTIHDFCLLTREERDKHLEGAPHYAVFIDEINRGNVARVLGELITLLEDDKRLGEDNELIVRLPYSGSLFGVPPNLHVIGTMNTADRSVEALDAALRRRFEFIEIPPLPEVFDFAVGPIDLGRLLQTMNRRIERLRDRDHRIGHAYLLSLRKEPTLDALKHAFATKVLPLLQEYFFGDWGKIGLVLGSDFVKKREDAVAFASFDHEDRTALENRPLYELVPMSELTDDHFRRIYEDAPDGS
jgi:hypothetical protein